jgi:hypothetical protein
VQVERRQNWRIYRLPEEQSHELQLHLECLRDCGRASDVFSADLQRLKSIPQAIQGDAYGQQNESLRSQSQAREEPLGLEAICSERPG